MSEVQRMLVVSTAHISLEADRKLKLDADGGYDYSPLSHDPVSYGWLIWVPEDLQEASDLKAWLELEKFDGLWDCLQKAAQARCRWLKLDADAAQSPELPVYDWD